MLPMDAWVGGTGVVHDCGFGGVDGDMVVCSPSV